MLRKSLFLEFLFVSWENFSKMGLSFAYIFCTYRKILGLSLVARKKSWRKIVAATIFPLSCFYVLQFSNWTALIHTAAGRNTLLFLHCSGHKYHAVNSYRASACHRQPTPPTLQDVWWLEERHFDKRQSQHLVIWGRNKKALSKVGPKVCRKCESRAMMTAGPPPSSSLSKSLPKYLIAFWRPKTYHIWICRQIRMVFDDLLRMPLGWRSLCG